MTLKEEIQRLLRSHGIFPDKRRGQNFLVSPEDLELIAHAALLGPAETIVEVGAGVGNLTEVLVKSGAPLIAIEKDGNLVELLTKKFREHPRVRIVEGNILEQEELPTPYVLVGNIPYYLTGALLRKFLVEVAPPRRIVLTIQKEVAERIVSAPPRATFLSNMVSLFGEAKVIHHIPPSHFWPEPKVSSAVLCIDVKDMSEKKRGEALRLLAFIRQGFRQPRKTLLNNLFAAGHQREEVISVLKGSNIALLSRPQDLSPDVWENLYQRLKAPHI